MGIVAVAVKKNKTKSEEIALAAAKEAIKELREEEKAARKKQIFQNTNVLLEHYLDLKTYCDKAIFTGEILIEPEEEIDDEDFIKELEKDEVTARSIKINVETTKIYVSHIDIALEQLKEKCFVKDEFKQYKVITMLHMDKDLQAVPWTERIALVADELECGESTVRRWRNEMVKELSIFLFGVDGLKLIF